jgi:transglutaminase-like putative cysteine protease
MKVSTLLVVLAFAACQSDTGTTSLHDEDLSSWYGIFIGQEKIGVEQRHLELMANGQRRWHRERRYRFSVAGVRNEAGGNSITTTDKDSRLLRYEHQAGAERREAWMDGENLVTVLTKADGGSERAVFPSQAPVAIDLVDELAPLVGIRAPVLESFNLKPTWVYFEGSAAELSWTINGTRAKHSLTGGSFGILSWEKTSKSEAESLECCVELLSMYRMMTPALPLARTSRLGTYNLEYSDGSVTTLNEERPLWLEIPAGGVIDLGKSDELELELRRRRIAPVLAGVTDKRTAVSRLLGWVRTELDVEVTPGSQGHLYALQRGAGDCSEHTSLFVAMANAIGIEASTQWGWVYWDGLYGPGFYPHAWAIVVLDGIGAVPVDPILGQFPADATHIVPAGDPGSMKTALLIPGAKIEVKLLEK